MSEYLRYEREPDRPGGRTKRWRVIASRDDALLGRIRWFGRWRQYAFFPEPKTIFNPDCLDSIAAFARSATGEQLRAAKRRGAA